MVILDEMAKFVLWMPGSYHSKEIWVGNFQTTLNDFVYYCNSPNSWIFEKSVEYPYYSITSVKRTCELCCESEKLKCGLTYRPLDLKMYIFFFFLQNMALRKAYISMTHKIYAAFKSSSLSVLNAECRKKPQSINKAVRHALNSSSHHVDISAAEQNV